MKYFKYCMLFFILIYASQLFAQNPDSKEANWKTEVEENLAWFSNNPSANDYSNLNERFMASDYLDEIAYKPLVSDWYIYRKNSFNNKQSSNLALEKSYPVFYYLRLAENKVLDEIVNTKISNGVKIWKLYNMGLIVKTPEKCFGIDILPIAVDFSKYLDFLIISHAHPDHCDKKIDSKMLKLNKPIFGYRSLNHNCVNNFISKNCIVKQGEVTIEFTVSSQGPYNTPCLLSLFDCGPSTGNFKVLHTGDANRIKDFPNYSGIDILDCPVDVGLDLKSAIKLFQPKYIILDHIMEQIYHSAKGIKYRTAYSLANDLLDLSTIKILTWGESLTFASPYK